MTISKFLALSGVLGAVAFFGALWLEHRTATALPAPTGPYAVGRAIYDWTDNANPDTLAPVPGIKRELLVWIWYPSEALQSAAMEDYLPAPLRAEVERDRGALISHLLTRDLSKVHTHSIVKGSVSARETSYPVAIIRAGASSGIWNYSTLAEDLASHGYIVVGFDAPYRTDTVVFPDGRVMRRTPQNNPELCDGEPPSQQEVCVSTVFTAWTRDIGFVLDRLAQLNGADPSGKFTGRLDMTRVGVFGHSFGGAAAAQFCHDDSRCKAAIDVDGAPFGSVVREGMDKPFLFLLSDHSHESAAESAQILANIQSIYDRLPAAGRLRIAIRGANHFLFSDDGALLKSQIVMGALRMAGILGIDGRRQLAVTAYCVRTFFDEYLKGAGDSRLKISSPLYPEIVMWGGPPGLPSSAPFFLDRLPTK
jgi:predicted dienelactone hydrolase